MKHLVRISRPSKAQSDTTTQLKDAVIQFILYPVETVIEVLLK